jgi:chromosome segregation ATPase
MKSTHITPVDEDRELGELHSALRAVDGLVGRERARADRLGHELAAVQARLSREAEQASSRLGELTEEKDRLDARIATLAQQNSVLQQRLADSASDAKRLRERLASHESTGAEARESLQTQLEGARALLESSRNRASDHIQAAEQLRARLAKVTTEYESLRRSAIEREARYRDAFAQFQRRDKALTENAVATRRAYDAARAELATRTAALSEAERARAAGAQSLREAEQTVARYNELKAQVATLEEWNRSLGESMGAEKKRILELEASLASERLERDSLAQKLRAAEARATEAESRAVQAEEREAQNSRELARANASLREMAANRLARVRENPATIRPAPEPEPDFDRLLSEAPLVGYPIGPGSIT